MTTWVGQMSLFVLPRKTKKTFPEGVIFGPPNENAKVRGFGVTVGPQVRKERWDAIPGWWKNLSQSEEAEKGGAG